MVALMAVLRVAQRVVKSVAWKVEKMVDEMAALKAVEMVAL